MIVEAPMPLPTTQKDIARDAEVRLLGLTCSGCYYLRYGAEKKPGDTRRNFDVYWCSHSEFFGTNKWRKPEWPACWKREGYRLDPPP